MTESAAKPAEKWTLSWRSFFKAVLIALACCMLGAYLLLVWLLYSPVYPQVILRADCGRKSGAYNLDKILDGRRQEYYFDSHGNKLHGWLFQKPHSDVIVIVHHGNAGNILNRLYLARACLKAGTSVFLYDYRGYGKSSGNASLPGILEDGLAAFDFVKGKFGYPVIVNYGESIGSGVACNVDRHRESKALILQSGIKSLPGIVKDHVSIFNLYPDCVWPQPQLNNGVLLSQSTTPLLVVHGERDTVVPAGHSQYLFDCAAAADKTLVKLPNCGHNDIGYYDAELFQRAISSFICKHSTVGDPNRCCMPVPFAATWNEGADSRDGPAGQRRLVPGATRSVRCHSGILSSCIINGAASGARCPWVFSQICETSPQANAMPPYR